MWSTQDDIYGQWWESVKAALVYSCKGTPRAIYMHLPHTHTHSLSLSLSLRVSEATDKELIKEKFRTMGNENSTTTSRGGWFSS